MNRIRLNDGTEYPVEYCGLSDNVVGFRIAAPGTIADLAPIFGDPEKRTKSPTCWKTPWFRISPLWRRCMRATPGISAC